MSRQTTPLRLTALDEADLEPISAALQDAIAQLGDFSYARKQRSFTLVFNRFCWERGGRALRVRTGVQVGSVIAARSANIRQGAADAVVNLLSIRFEALDPPAGELILLFSGGGELRLDVECLDIALADVSQPWPASRRPDHQMDEHQTDE